MNREDRPAWEKPYWLDDDATPKQVERGLLKRLIGWPLAVFVIVLLIGAGSWGISVLVSPVKGKGDVIRQNQDAGNRINSQAYFQDLYGDIQAYGPQLTLAISQEKAHPGDDFYTTNFTGLYNTCVSAVTQYNAASSKTLFHDWKSADLPQTINPTDACPSK